MVWNTVGSMILMSGETLVICENQQVMMVRYVVIEIFEDQEVLYM